MFSELPAKEMADADDAGIVRGMVGGLFSYLAWFLCYGLYALVLFVAGRRFGVSDDVLMTTALATACVALGVWPPWVYWYDPRVQCLVRLVGRGGVRALNIGLGIAVVVYGVHAHREQEALARTCAAMSTTRPYAERFAHPDLLRQCPEFSGGAGIR